MASVELSPLLYGGALLIRFFYLVALSSVLIVTLIPALRERFIDYGKITQIPRPPTSSSPFPWINTGLDWINDTFKVKKQRFVDFYWVGSIVNAIVIMYGLPKYFGYLSRRPSSNSYLSMIPGFLSNPATSMEAEKCLQWQSEIMIMAALFQIHTFRRLFECHFIQRSNPNATIHLFHYLVGVLYYMVTPLALIMDQLILRESSSCSTRIPCSYMITIFM